MDQKTFQDYAGRRVPRYTSYPTAPHFSAAVGEAAYREWLADLPADTPLSLYLHVPYCETLCWYCGCHTKATRRYAPVARYLETLRAEIALVADGLPGRLPVRHVAWGGGTPSLVSAADLLAVMRLLRDRFDLSPDAEIAMEVDPRTVDPDGLAAAGVNRVSLGVQTFHAPTQRAINRVQSFAETAAVARRLRDAGIARLNVDLLYGLPHETAESCRETVRLGLTLEPERFAVFGYAHLPAMLKHQRLIDGAALPDAAERLAQLQAVAETLDEAGFVAIGLDHFARPDDGLARAQTAGTLRRNFQGYTDDACPALLGFGASAISALPLGYAQNVVAMVDYQVAVAAGRLPTARGIALSGDDALRRAVIERLMCDLTVDLQTVAARHGATAAAFARERAMLHDMASQGLVRLTGSTVTVEPENRALVRNVAAVFDAYLRPEAGRHARAV